MHPRHLLAIGVLVASIAAPVASAASKDFSLSLAPKVSMLQPGDSISEDFTVTNNTSSAATCDLYVEQIDFDIPLGTIGPNQSAGGGLSTPPTGKVTKLTFDLNCDGNLITSKSIVAIVK